MKFGKDDIVIEVNDERAGNWIFPPQWQRGVLRGKYDLSKLPRSVNRRTGLLNENVPGMYIWLNVKERRGGIVDPLSFPENKNKAQDIAAANNATRFQPEDETKIDNMPQNDVATWWYWMKIGVEHGAVASFDEGGKKRTRHPKCMVVQNGDLLDDSKQPAGRIRIDFNSKSTWNPKTRQGTPIFLDQFDDWRRHEPPTHDAATGEAIAK